MKTRLLLLLPVCICAILVIFSLKAGSSGEPAKSGVYDLHEGYVDANGVLTYYKMIGNGPPLLIAHGGPGASHDYFLPYLLPLARQNRLIFIDERG